MLLILQAAFTRNTLGRSEKLKSRKIIEGLFTKGESLFLHPFKLLYQIVSLDTKFPAQIAVSVPKRNFKKAADRNKVKRLIREAYRLNKAELYNFLTASNQQCAFIVVYCDDKILTYHEIEVKIKKLIQRFINKDG